MILRKLKFGILVHSIKEKECKKIFDSNKAYFVKLIKFEMVSMQLIY